MGLMVMMLNCLFLIVNRWRKMLPTLCTEAAGAVVCSQGHPVTQPSSMFGLWSGTLSAALPVAVWTAHWPLAPLSPAAVHWGNKIQTQTFKNARVHMHRFDADAQLEYIVIPSFPLDYMHVCEEAYKQSTKEWRRYRKIGRWKEPFFF